MLQNHVRRGILTRSCNKPGSRLERRTPIELPVKREAERITMTTSPGHAVAEPAQSVRAAVAVVVQDVQVTDSPANIATARVFLASVT